MDFPVFFLNWFEFEVSVELLVHLLDRFFSSSHVNVAETAESRPKFGRRPTGFQNSSKTSEINTFFFKFSYKKNVISSPIHRVLLMEF